MKGGTHDIMRGSEDRST